MTTPQAPVEDWLRAEKRYNEQHGILRSENAVIDRLLENRINMAGVYSQLALLEAFQWQEIMRAVVSTAAFWSPEAIGRTRDQVGELHDINGQIAERAEELARLLERRSEITEHSSLHAYDDVHPMDWIERAAAHNYLYKSWVEPEVEKLLNQFDLKYWPNTADVVRAVAEYAQEAEVRPCDPYTAAALASRQRSVGDFIRPLLERIDGLRECPPVWLPRRFNLSDPAIAEIANCALDLAEPMDGAAVKMIRHRRR